MKLDHVNYFVDLTDPAHPKAAAEGSSINTISTVVRDGQPTNSAAGLSDRLADIAEEVFAAYGSTIKTLGDS